MSDVCAEAMTLMLYGGKGHDGRNVVAVRDFVIYFTNEPHCRIPFRGSIISCAEKQYSEKRNKVKVKPMMCHVSY